VKIFMKSSNSKTTLIDVAKLNVNY